jgi:hypothetical protein
MMKCLKLRIDSEDRIADVFEALQKVKSEQILLICPRQWGVSTDATLLKKLVASVPQKNIIFVIPQKFSRDFVAHLGLATVAACSEESEDIPEQTVAEVLVGEKIIFTPTIPVVEMPAFVSRNVPKTSSFSISRSLIFFILIGILVLSGGVAFWLRPRVIITVKPRIEAVPIVQNVIVVLPEATPSAINADLPQISGIFVENHQEGIELYPTTGREYDIENAHGKVTIFNENGREKFFVPSRLESPDGLIFRFADDISVPAAENGAPGEFVVEIQADPFDSDGNPVGFRGNIDAGTDLQFSALPPVSRELWYAKANRGPLVGGSTLTHFFVTKEDEELAEDFLQKKFLEISLAELRTEVSRRSMREKEKQVLLDDASLLRVEFSDYVFPKDLVGTESQTIEISGKMNVAGLVFSESEVSRLVLERLTATLDDRQRLLEIDNHSAEYRVLDASEFADNGWVKLSVKMVGVRSLDFNSSAPQNMAWKTALREELAQKTEAEARAILVNQPEIERVLDIQIFPTWKKTLPSMLSHIELRTAFD